MAISTADESALIDRAIPGSQPFIGTFKEGFQTLNQNDPNADANIGQRALNTTRQLAGIYVDEFVNQTGQLPSEQQVGDFLANSIDSGLAAKSLSSGLSDSEVRYQIVRPSIATSLNDKNIQNNANNQLDQFTKLANDNAAQRQNYLSQLVDSQIEQGTQDINQNYNQQRKNALDEEAALGRLTQPVSIENLSQIDQNRNKSLADLVRNIRAQGLQNSSDILGQTLNNIQQAQQFGATNALQQQAQALQNKSLSESVRQFNENLQNQINQQNQEVNLASKLGSLQAEANKPGTLDYINTAFQGLGALGSLGGSGVLTGLINSFKTPKKAGG